VELWEQYYTNLAGVAELLVFLAGSGVGVAPVIASTTTANLKTVYGQRTTITWIATGRINVAFQDNPGLFMGFGFAFRDTTTQANVKGFNCTAGTLVANAAAGTTPPTWSVEVDLWNGTSSYVAVDMATTNLLDLSFYFKMSRS
jgi:hypothetical protein